MRSHTAGKVTDEGKRRLRRPRLGWPRAAQAPARLRVEPRWSREPFVVGRPLGRRCVAVCEADLAENATLAFTGSPHRPLFLSAWRHRGRPWRGGGVANAARRLFLSAAGASLVLTAHDHAAGRCWGAFPARPVADCLASLATPAVWRGRLRGLRVSGRRPGGPWDADGQTDTPGCCLPRWPRRGRTAVGQAGSKAGRADGRVSLSPTAAHCGRS